MEFEQIRRIIADTLQLEPEDVTLEKDFDEDLGADSLDKVEIVMQLEEALGIEIADEDAESIKTVADAVEAIRRIAG